jgi:hypothetical protein
MLTNSENQGLFENNYFNNFLLLFFFLLIFLGIYLLNINTNFYSYIKSVISFLGFSSGNLIININDIIVDTSETGIDIAGDAINDAGNLLIDSTKESFDNILNNSNIIINNPEPDNTGDPIQNSISTNKNSLLNNGLKYIDINNENQLITKLNKGEEMIINPTFTPF